MKKANSERGNERQTIQWKLFSEFWEIAGAEIERLGVLMERLGCVTGVFRHAAAEVRSAADLRLKSRLRFQAMVTRVHSPEMASKPRR